MELRIVNEELSEKFYDLRFTIYNLLGKEVYSFQLRSTDSQLDLSELSGGIYFYKLANNQQQIADGKLVIE